MVFRPPRRTPARSQKDDPHYREQIVTLGELIAAVDSVADADAEVAAVVNRLLGRGLTARDPKGDSGHGEP